MIASRSTWTSTTKCNKSMGVWAENKKKMKRSKKYKFNNKKYI